MKQYYSLHFKVLIIYIILIVYCVTIVHAQKYQHIIIYGQSLSTGNQSWPPLSTTPVSGNFMIGDQVWTNLGNNVFNKFNPLISNVSSSTSSLPKNRSSYISAECPLIAATNHLQLKTGGQYRFIASSCGIGGKTIEELSKEYYNPVYYENFKNTLKYAYRITNYIHCPAIIWMQGEQNYTIPSGSEGVTAGSIPTSDKATYKSLLIKMKNNMQTEIKNTYYQTDTPLFITYQTGAQYTRGHFISIGMAQLEASNEYDDVVCAGPVYPMTDRGGHLDPNGYRWYGEMLGKAFYKTIMQGTKFKPLQPLEISRTDNPQVIKIRFYTPQLPLVFDDILVDKVTNYGFEVFVNSTKITVVSADIDNDCVYLTCASYINTGDLEIIYAGTNNYGHGNLRDSDNYPAFYNYIDLDKKNTNGSYVYQRESSETTLRPSFEPKDNNGIIYNKPYPLYNFCVAFYYKLSNNENSYTVPNLSSDINSLKIKETKIYSYQKTLYIETDHSNILYFDILDFSGKHIITLPVQNTSYDYSFNLNSLSKGLYLIRIISSDQTFTSKFFLQ